MTNFTKGPWTKGALHFYGANGEKVIVSDGPAFGSKAVFPDAEANAHLISAAPDMYEALESAVMLVNAGVIMVRPSDREAFLGALESWNNALAKARGES